MPGLAGLVSACNPVRNGDDILDSLKQVGLIKDVTYLYRPLGADQAIVLNTLTGLLKTSLDQPAIDPQGDVFLFLEGEVFNLDELRRQLPENPATSACEVLLALFILRGDKFIGLLNGEFNIVIYDKAAKRLSIFCDHIASMPMYYMEEGDRLLFGSEKKYILSMLTKSPTIDSVGLLQIFAHRYNLDDRTFLSGVKRMMPGTRLTYQRGRLEVQHHQILKFCVPDHRRRTVDLIDHWCAQIREATQLRLQGKNRLLISLSGGLDSRAIACAIPRNFRPVASRTRGIDHAPDVVVAARIADRLDLDHFQEDSATTYYSQEIAKIVWRTECETHFTNAISIASHSEAKVRGDFIAGGWLGDVSSGGHILPDLLLQQDRHRFIERVYRRHLTFSDGLLQNVFSRDFLQRELPNLREAFHDSFSYLKEETNMQNYEIWDLYQRQRRQTTSSMPADSYLFEKVRPFYDKDYLSFTLTLPMHLRFGQVLYQSMIYQLGPEIRDIPSANNSLNLQRSLVGNLWSKGFTSVHRAVRNRIRRLRPPNRRGIERHANLDIGLSLRQDASFRGLIERYLNSAEFDAAIFNRRGIRTLLDQHYNAVADHSYILGYVAMFSVGLPYFLNKTIRCPTEAEPLVKH